MMLLRRILEVLAVLIGLNFLLGFLLLVGGVFDVAGIERWFGAVFDLLAGLGLLGGVWYLEKRNRPGKG